jgi:hypothetical protein
LHLHKSAGSECHTTLTGTERLLVPKENVLLVPKENVLLVQKRMFFWCRRESSSGAESQTALTLARATLIYSNARRCVFSWKSMENNER